MKLLISDADNTVLEGMKDILEKNGIPAFINGENTSRTMPFITTKASLWVHLSEQAEEALLLINDPDYEVKNKVDMEEYNKIKNEYMNNPKNLNKGLGYLAAIVGFIMLAMFIVIIVLQWLST